MTKVAEAGRKGRGSMVPFWVVLGLAALLLILYTARGGFGRGAGAGQSAGSLGSSRPEAPQASVGRYDSPGQVVQLSDLKGKVVVLHFWATWCPPCRAEFPEFARFASGETEADVAVLPVSLDQTPDPIGPFLKGSAGAFPVYFDADGAMASQFQVAAIPTTVLLDKEGKVAWRRQGAVDWSSKGVPGLVESLRRE
jgi:cytochrome c biogenesis protein CcmG/thiol:disulfide interchange protein DsbE